MRRSTLQFETKRTYFTIKSIDRLRVHIDTPKMKKKTRKNIEQWEPTYLRRSVPSILYSNARNTCIDRYIYTERERVMGDEFHSLLFFLIYIVLFSCVRLVQLIIRKRKCFVHQRNMKKQYTGNSTDARFQTCRLLISKEGNRICLQKKKYSLEKKYSIGIITFVVTAKEIDLLTDQISNIEFAVLYLWCDHVKNRYTQMWQCWIISTRSYTSGKTRLFFFLSLSLAFR